MGVYAVALSKIETSVIHVEADSAPDAERIALDACHAWDSDTQDIQVDDITELVGEEAEGVQSICITEE